MPKVTKIIQNLKKKRTIIYTKINILYIFSKRNNKRKKRNKRILSYHQRIIWSLPLVHFFFLLFIFNLFVYLFNHIVY